MKKLMIFLLVFGSAAAMEQTNIPKFSGFGNVRHSWIDNFKLFDIAPVFNEHLSKLTPVGRIFVNNITELKLKSCKDLAEVHFRRQDTEEAQKCMELLAMTVGWRKSRGGNHPLLEQIVSMYSADEVTRNSIRHKEFIGDVMYMAMYKTLRKEDGSPVDEDEFDEDRAEFFRYMANEMYGSVDGKSFADRKGLDNAFVNYSESPKYYPNDVWRNW
jgi:hypothetical protein